MAQFGRPSTDKTIGSYTDSTGGTTNIYGSIDETVADDADFVRSPTDPSSQVYVTKLTSITDPAVGTGHVIRVRAGTDQASGGNQIDMVAEIRQGYVAETSLGTLIATLTQTNITAGGWTTYTYALTTTEANAISNYGDLYLRVSMNKP